MAPTIRLLDSGYWHVRWSLNQFAQWPKYQECKTDDVFPRGWATPAMAKQAQEMADASR